MHQRPDRQDPTLDAPLATVRPEKRPLLSFSEHSRPARPPRKANFLSLPFLLEAVCLRMFPDSPSHTCRLICQLWQEEGQTLFCTTPQLTAVTSYLEDKTKQNKKIKKNILRKGLFGLTVFGAILSWREWHRDRNVRQLAKLCPQEADR